jgi:hypothetical protein
MADERAQIPSWRAGGTGPHLAGRLAAGAIHEIVRQLPAKGAELGYRVNSAGNSTKGLLGKASFVLLRYYMP